MKTLTKPTSGRVVMTAVRETMRLIGAPDRVAIAPFTACGHTIHLKTLTAERQAALFVYRREHPDDFVGYLLRIIAASVCDRHGDVVYTHEQAGELDTEFAMVILTEAIARNRMDCVPAESIT